MAAKNLLLLVLLYCRSFVTNFYISTLSADNNLRRWKMDEVVWRGLIRYNPLLLNLIAESAIFRNVGINEMMVDNEEEMEKERQEKKIEKDNVFKELYLIYYFAQSS